MIQTLHGTPCSRQETNRFTYNPTPQVPRTPVLVYLGIVGKPSTRDAAEDDRIFEPGQNRTSAIKREGLGERVVGLYDREPEGEGEVMGTRIAPWNRTLPAPRRIVFGV